MKSEKTLEASIQVSDHQDSPAVALAHVEAWSNHDWDKVRASLAPDILLLPFALSPSGSFRMTMPNAKGKSQHTYLGLIKCPSHAHLYCG